MNSEKSSGSRCSIVIPPPLLPVVPPPLAADVQSHIGRELQAIFDEVLHEPVPDRFLKLLQELDRKKDVL